MAIFSGDIFAENYTVSSSVTNVQISSVSGSTKSGDSTDDIHQFTGSMGILHAGANESQTGLLIRNSGGSSNSSARLLFQGNGGDYGTIGTIASRNTNASYDDVDYARIKFVIPGSSMTTHGIEFHTGDGGAATKKFEIHGNKISGSSTSVGSFGFLRMPDGSASTPAYSFASDTNTGMFRPASDQIGWTLGGTQRLYLDANNLYGGTSTGMGMLRVAGVGDATNAAFGFYGDNNTGMYRIAADRLGFTAGGHVLEIAQNKISGSSTSTGSFGDIKVGDNTAQTNRSIMFAGDEGFKIGYAQSGFLASTGAASDGADAEIVMTGTGGSAPFDQHGSIVYKTRAVDVLSRSSHIFYTGRTSAERVRIDHDGNLGIGEAAPSEKLSMEGNVFLTDGSPKIYFTDRGGGNSAEIKRESHTLKLTAYSSGVKSSEIHLQARAADDGASRGGILFRTATHQHTSNGPQDAVYINLSGSVELMRDGANLSGSSSSTGSFGQVSTGTITPLASNGTISLQSTEAPLRINRLGASSYLFGPTSVVAGENTLSIYPETNSSGINLRGKNSSGTLQTGLLVDADGNTRFYGTKISGSATSTGSFGKLIVDDARFKDDIFIGSAGTSGFRDGSDTQIQVYIANTARFKWYNNGGNIYFGSNNASGPNIYSAASSTTNATYRISGTTNTGWGGGTDKISGIIGGTEVLQIAANKISGSSTSTGSFGSLFLHGGNTLKVDPTTNRFLAEGTTSGRGFMVRDIDHNSSASFYQSGASTRIEAHTGTAINFLIGGTTYAYVDNDGQMHVSATGQDHKPGYTFITDTDTGMYHAGTDALGLTVGGTEQLRIASNTISGSATSTGSFGKVTVGGPVFNDVSSSRHSTLTVHSPSGANATGSAITIVGDSFQGRQRINWDMEGLDGKVYSYIEARGQGGGRNRGELYFGTRNGSRDAFEAVPRLGINQAGRVSIMGTFGQTESQVAGGTMMFNSASLNVFTGNTFDSAPYAGWFENRVDATGKGGIYISTVTGRDTNAIIRAVKRTLAGVETKVFEVLANGQISGSATSTGSFGRLESSKARVEDKLEVFQKMSIFGGHSSNIENTAALSIYSDTKTAIHIDHDDYDTPAVYIDTTNSGDKALEIYSNAAATANPLVSVIAENASMDNELIHLRQDGNNGAITITNNGTGDGIVYTGGQHAISGSSTSTGSFGKLIVDDARFKDDIFIGSAGTSGFRDGSDTQIQVYIANTARFKWYNNGGNIYFGSNNASGPNIYSAASSTTNATYRISGTTNTGWGGGTDKISGIIGGTEVLQIAANKISGSASSTGSFGQLKAGKISVLDESRFDLAYLPDLQFYEEAMYTATLSPQGSGTITLNSDWNKLGFTRIGNKVHVHGNIIVSSVSSPVGTNVALNLPYQTRGNSVSSNSSIRQTGTLVYYDTSNWYSMPMMIDENDTVVLLLFDSFRSLGGSAPPNVNTVAASWQFRIDFHYFIGRFD